MLKWKVVHLEILEMWPTTGYCEMVIHQRYLQAALFAPECSGLFGNVAKRINPYLSAVAETYELLVSDPIRWVSRKKLGIGSKVDSF